VIKATGFGVGEFATLKLDFSGAPPGAEGFTVSDLSVVDSTSGATITGLTPVAAVQIR
jgi:hypothetical protein